MVKPRGIAHTYWNPGPGPARLIEITETAARYHRHFRQELEQPLVEKHGLKLIGT